MIYIMNVFMACIMYTIFAAMIGVLIFFYLRNANKAIQAVRASRISIRTILRVAGIFFPFLGLAMGFVKGE